MKYIINKQNSIHAYIQLYNQLREDIVKNLYSYGEKLPSKRIMAEETGISTVTVEHAYSLLCDEGYVESRERSGYFVIFRRDGGFALPAADISPPSEIAVENGQMFDFPFSVLTKAMRRVMNDYGEAILNRPPNPGCIQLRLEISKYLARSRGIFADVDQIIIGSGSEYLYSLIVGLLGRDKRYAIEFPSYKQIEQVYMTAGVSYERLPLGADGIDSAPLWKSNADILHISPQRSFPSGVSASASKLHEYLSWGETPGRYIIEDDFESEFSVLKKPQDTLFSQTCADNVIYMNTFSKTISASLRTGYMVLPKHLASAFDKKLGFYSCTVPTYVQLVIAHLIASGDFERHINRVRRKKRKHNNNC